MSRYDKFIEGIGKVLKIKEEKDNDIEYLQETLSKYSSSNLEIQSYKIEVDSIKGSLTEIQNEISNIGVCPYCGSVLGGNHEQC